MSAARNLAVFVLGAVLAGIGSTFLDRAWRLGTMSAWCLLEVPGLLLVGFALGRVGWTSRPSPPP